MVGRTVGGMAGGTVGGMVSLATRQTPIIHNNTPACGGIIIYLGDLAADHPPTVPPAIPPTVRPTILPAISPPIPPSSPENPATHQLLS